MEPSDIFPFLAIVSVFIIFPLIVMHYMLQFRKMRTMSERDEQTIEELYESAHRLEDRLRSIERIIAADHPNWKDRAVEKEQ